MADAAMIDPHKYDSLRATERQVQAERKFADAGHEATKPQPREQQAEKPFLTDLDRHEANRVALTERLDAQVSDQKITAQERRYRLERFEVHGLEPESRRTALEKLQQHAEGRPPAPGDRDAARAALQQHIDLGGVGPSPDIGLDMGRKPGIER